MSDAWSTSLTASRAPGQVVAANHIRTAKEREMEALDAFFFLTLAHDDVVGSKLGDNIARYGGDLNRNYDPMPYPEATPTPSSDYVATGIGFLYGLNESPTFAADCAGWNVRRSR